MPVIRLLAALGASLGGSAATPDDTRAIPATPASKKDMTRWLRMDWLLRNERTVMACPTEFGVEYRGIERERDPRRFPFGRGTEDKRKRGGKDDARNEEKGWD